MSKLMVDLTFDFILAAMLGADYRTLQAQRDATRGPFSEASRWRRAVEGGARLRGATAPARVRSPRSLRRPALGPLESAGR